MYNINPSYIFKNWYQNLYIARKSSVEEDSNHNKIALYEKAQEYKRWNIQYVKSQSEIIEFGELASKMRVAVIPNTPEYAGKFKEFDLAYLDGVKPYTIEEVINQNNNTSTTEIVWETVNGQNANYRIYSVRPQNTIIKVYFLSLTK